MATTQCVGCFKPFQRSSARPYCNDKCRERDEKNKAYQARLARRNEAWRLGRARGLERNYTAMLQFVQDCETEVILLPSKEEIDAELDRVFAGLNAHRECRDHFMTYGSASYSNHHDGGELCEVCGNQLLCAGERKKHAFHELTQQECRDRGIYHGGRCYHVHECTNPGCGFIRAYDSSD